MTAILKPYLAIITDLETEIDNMKENVRPAPINTTRQYTPRQPLASITNQASRDKPIWKIPDSVKSNDLIQGYSGQGGYPITYCWSCGITGNLLHHSRTCKSKKDGHQEKATLTNQMGGNPNKFVSAFKRRQAEKGKAAVREDPRLCIYYTTRKILAAVSQFLVADV